ncbi:FMN-binding protein [Catellatospora chokoriensis]|uniref:FMN-binding protein n=1 Tax=Catellatospora chokoriensis TaxID=310353 RepID=A0A8J3K784_9ACTN|nr:FMN-binding protein [Catellatospora chokoriensis]GIF90754.1 FMN-binding protein [Catellatospora chokoriensis]
MRKITFFLLATIAGLVGLFSYRTSLGEAVPQAGPAGAAPPAPPPAAIVDGRVVDGDAVVTDYGTVQVRVTFAGGRIADVAVLQKHTVHEHSLVLNELALPRLREQVLDAQSAEVDTVSGATATSRAYLDSLQSAIDRAHVR